MAYPNLLIVEGLRGSYMADPAGTTLGIWTRCKFASPATQNADGTPVLQLCAATDRAAVVLLQPCAAGAYGVCALPNGGGALIGLCSGSITLGAAVYGAAAGKISASSAGGAVLAGYATKVGADGDYISYLPLFAAA